MKATGKRFPVLILVIMASLMCIVCSFKGCTGSSPVAGSSVMQIKGDMVMTITSRKLKDTRYEGSRNKGDVAGNVNLEDYRPIDPVPSSKASIRPGPIQHGTPLMPFVPGPSPPPTHQEYVGIP